MPGIQNTETDIPKRLDRIEQMLDLYMRQLQMDLAKVGSLVGVVADELTVDRPYLLTSGRSPRPVKTEG